MKENSDTRKTQICGTSTYWGEQEKHQRILKERKFRKQPQNSSLDSVLREGSLQREEIEGVPFCQYWCQRNFNFGSRTLREELLRLLDGWGNIQDMREPGCGRPPWQGALPLKWPLTLFSGLSTQKFHQIIFRTNFSLFEMNVLPAVSGFLH